VRHDCDRYDDRGCADRAADNGELFFLYLFQPPLPRFFVGLLA
jgi:hypothetical protein